MLVRIKNGYENSAEELNMVFVVVEDNGDRLLIAENRDRRFPNEIIPTELVRDFQIEEI